MAEGTGDEVVPVKINNPRMTIESYLMNNLESEEENRKKYIFFLGIPYAKPPTGENRFKVIKIRLYLRSTIVINLTKGAI